MQDPYDLFHHYFELITATSPELVNTALSLRYQVYCMEHNFEDPHAYPDGMERDEFDWRAVHGLIRHRKSESFAGTVRLVLPHPIQPHAPFPVELHCNEAFYLDYIEQQKYQHIPRCSLAEISRFAVSKQFKRRGLESETVAGASEEVVYRDSVETATGRRSFPHITIGLMACIVRMSVENNITHWYAVMEPTLLRLLARYGIRFEPVGEMINYHGKRRPTIAAVDRVLSEIYSERSEVWKVITDCGRLKPLNTAVGGQRIAP